MTTRKPTQATPFRRMRLVEVNDQLANDQLAEDQLTNEKLIRHDDPLVSSMARVLPLIRNPKRTKNATADLAVSVANMQHYKALERQRRSDDVQQALQKGMEAGMEMGALSLTTKPKVQPKPRRAKQSKRKQSGLVSPRRTRKHEPSVWKVYE